MDDVRRTRGSVSGGERSGFWPLPPNWSPSVGYLSAGLVDVGAQADIVGSGIDRHFPARDAVLVALLGKVMRRLSDSRWRHGDQFDSAQRTRGPVSAGRQTYPDRHFAVHAAIGAIQSTLFFRSGLPPLRLAELLRTAAHGSLGVAPTYTGIGERGITRALDQLRSA